ncbi:hypothetical protein GC170_14485 [bacterium]|nr:hypothetical protein [bacterium]
MAEANAFGLPNGQPIASAWSRVIRNQKVALRKLLDNARFVNASIVRSEVDGALRVWRKDLDAFTDELTGRMTPYMASVATRSGNAIRSRAGLRKADDWFIRDPARVQALEATVLDLCKDTLDTIGVEVADKIATIRAELIRGEIDDGTGGWKDLYTQLDKYFDDSAKWRSARIARTEASRAANWGIRASAEELDDLIGFEWLMAPGACEACQRVGKGPGGNPRRVMKSDKFATDVGPKITNVDDPERRRIIPEEYRQIAFPPLHPHCRCSLKPVFVPLNGSTVVFDRPYSAGGQYIPNTAEIAPLDLSA